MLIARPGTGPLFAARHIDAAMAKVRLMDLQETVQVGPAWWLRHTCQAGSVGVLAVVSPGCAWCVRGVIYIRQSMLQADITYVETTTANLDTHTDYHELVCVPHGARMLRIVRQTAACGIWPSWF